MSLQQAMSTTEEVLGGGRGVEVRSWGRREIRSWAGPFEAVPAVQFYSTCIPEFGRPADADGDAITGSFVDVR